jgi:hypothetical protein
VPTFIGLEGADLAGGIEIPILTKYFLVPVSMV